jgi:SAM-dependent methyltransferase
VGTRQLADALVSLTPRFRGGRCGAGWFRILEPRRQIPDEQTASRVGEGGFLDVGLSWLEALVWMADLDPGDRVLDVGCGVGRIAFPLTYFLDPRGSYEGLDVAAELLRWPRAHIARKFPNFGFHHADVRNGMYNPAGRIEPGEFQFPFADRSFDVVVATSLFTHLLPDTMPHYLAQMRRVLKPGGRVLCTAFVIDEGAEARIAAGASTQPLSARAGLAFVANRDVPEAAVGYRSEVLTAWIQQAGLRVARMRPGSWSGRTSLNYQDTLVLQE